MNPVTGFLVGLLAAIVGAAIWAIVTIVTEYQIGFMAIGVGALCGLAVGYTGGGNSGLKGILGALTAVVGCALGNLLSAIGLYAKHQEIPWLEAYQTFDYSQSVAVLTAFFQPIDLLFYAIALFQGYKIAASIGTGFKQD